MASPIKELMQPQHRRNTHRTTHTSTHTHKRTHIHTTSSMWFKRIVDSRQRRPLCSVRRGQLFLKKGTIDVAETGSGKKVAFMLSAYSRMTNIGLWRRNQRCGCIFWRGFFLWSGPRCYCGLTDFGSKSSRHLHPRSRCNFWLHDIRQNFWLLDLPVAGHYFCLSVSGSRKNADDNLNAWCYVSNQRAKSRTTTPEKRTRAESPPNSPAWMLATATIRCRHVCFADFVL